MQLQLRWRWRWRQRGLNHSQARRLEQPQRRQYQLRQRELQQHVARSMSQNMLHQEAFSPESCDSRLATTSPKSCMSKASRESYWPTLIGSSCQPEAVLVLTSSLVTVDPSAAAFMFSVPFSCIVLGVVVVCSFFHIHEIPSRNNLVRGRGKV